MYGSRQIGPSLTQGPNCPLFCGGQLGSGAQLTGAIPEYQMVRVGGQIWYQPRTADHPPFAAIALLLSSLV